MKSTAEHGDQRTQFYGFRDLWQLLIKFIIVALIIAWFVQEYLSDQGVDPITLIILLLLLLFLIWLILRQRHVIRLRCDLTAPGNCVRGHDDILSGRILEPVVGSAYGWGFSHYLLELRDPGGDPVNDAVIYRDAGGNPDPAATSGGSAVTNGTLGWIDVEKAVTDAGIKLLTSTTFTITLRVFGVDGSELSPPCTISFDVSVNEVYIKRVSSPWSVDYTDEDEPLRGSDDPAAALSTIGGTMHVRGAADVHGCDGQKIEEYTIWAIPDPSFTFAQPAPLNPVTPGSDWVQVAHIEFHPQTVDGTSYTADQVREYNRLDGDPHPSILTNVWGTRKECFCAFIDWTIACTCWKVPALKAKAFNSNALLASKLDPSHEGATGKFTFLLQVIDTDGNQYYDVQRAWIDNEPIHASIDGVQGLAACTDLYMREQDGSFKTVKVEGTAWDQLIDPGDPATPTSDNFHRYTLHFKKQGAAGTAELIDSPTPIPPRPNPVGVGTLVDWDLATVDADSNPLGLPQDQLLEKHEECTYNLILQVWDRTVVNESTVHWSGWVIFPIKLINSKGP